MKQTFEGEALWGFHASYSKVTVVTNNDLRYKAYSQLLLTSGLRHLHSLEGPSLTFTLINGSIINEYYINGIYYPIEEFKKYVHDLQFKEKINGLINED